MFAEAWVLVEPVEDAILTPRSAAGDEGAVCGCEHREKDVVEDALIIFEEGCLVGEDLMGGETAEEVFAGRQGVDAATVAEELLGALKFGDEPFEEGWREAVKEVGDALHENEALTQAGGDEKRGGIRLSNCEPDGSYSKAGGLAGLPTHADDDTFARVA